jgi:phage terminase small subunit
VKSEKGEMEKKKQNHAITPKQEKFCQEYLKCGNASEAYRLSYNISNMKPQSVNRAAKQLLDNTKIASRIKEIQAPALQETHLTLVSHLNELQRLKEFAEDLQKPASAIKAEELRGKAAGLYTEKYEIDKKVRVLIVNV